jgi:hypothetical protein
MPQQPGALHGVGCPDDHVSLCGMEACLRCLGRGGCLLVRLTAKCKPQEDRIPSSLQSSRRLAGNQLAFSARIVSWRIHGIGSSACASTSQTPLSSPMVSMP